MKVATMRNEILAALRCYQDHLRTIAVDDERPQIAETVQSGNDLIQKMARFIVEELREARA